jgi:hypothetical protein
MRKNSRGKLSGAVRDETLAEVQRQEEQVSSRDKSAISPDTDAVPRANTGGARENAGRPSGASDATLSAARLISPTQKWAFAEKALQHAERAIEVLVEIMERGESETARVSAANKILDRALGKAPKHIDITALRHTEIVYRSAEEIRKALMDEGMPKALLDLTDEKDDEE